jgi:hypothetical protein
MFFEAVDESVVSRKGQVPKSGTMRIVENDTRRVLRWKDERTRKQIATVHRVGGASRSAMLSRARVRAKPGRVMSMRRVALPVLNERRYQATQSAQVGLPSLVVTRKDVVE